MDLFLSKVTQQAMNYAIRSGVTITAGYALRQSARLLRNVKSSQRDELVKLQERLQQKIKIISPAIDMIELISARGNTSLESAISLTKEIRWEMQSLGQRLGKAASDEEASRRNSSRAKTQAQTDIELKLIAQDLQKLLDRIEDAVPLINLAITTSGASLSTSLPATVSPSRLLQASTFLTRADTQYCMNPTQSIPVGPTFTLSVYMLFEGHIREEGIRETTWKEVIHKARVKLRRTPMNLAFARPQQQPGANSEPPTPTHQPTGDYFDSHMAGDARADEFAYQLMIIEDFDDDRMHDFEDSEIKPGRVDDVDLAGIREIVPVHEVSKIFYADTGKILNIGSEGETNSPVLLLKRDVNAIPPRRMMERNVTNEDEFDDGNDVPSSQPNGEQSELNDHLKEHEQDGSRQDSADPWRLPPGLDPEWIAFEVYTEAEDSDTESEPGLPHPPSRKSSLSPSVAPAFSGLRIDSSPNVKSQSSSPSSPAARNELLPQASRGSIYPFPSQFNAQGPSFNNIRTSLSLLEVLLRLTSLQQFQQQSHLAINDELLNFFLEESSATGAGGDEAHRQRIRAEARRRVGWDPYDESPVKRRGEEYQYQTEEGDGRWGNGGGEWDRDMDRYEYEQSPRSAPMGPASRGCHVPSRDETPERPTMLLKNHSSRGSTSDSNGYSRHPFPNMKSPSTPSGPPKGRQAYWRRQTDEEGAGRRGSPLARPNTVVTDEGLGTSPSSQPGKGGRNDGQHAAIEKTEGN